MYDESLHLKSKIHTLIKDAQCRLAESRGGLKKMLEICLFVVAMQNQVSLTQPTS